MKSSTRRPLVLAMALILAAIASAGPAAADRDHVIVPEDYFGITSLGGVSVSPDGALVAYTESRWPDGEGGREQELWLVARDGGDPLRLTFGNFGAGGAHWAPDGSWPRNPSTSSSPTSAFPMAPVSRSSTSAPAGAYH